MIHISRYYYPHSGGVETHLEALCGELIAVGYDVTVVCEQHDETIPLEEEVDGVMIRRIPYDLAGSKHGVWKYIWSQRDILGSTDVLHIHDVGWWVLPLLARHPRLKYYMTFHGYEGVNPPHWRSRLQRRFWARSCRDYICVGEFMGSWYGIEPRNLIYGAADIRPKKKIDNRLAYIGRLDEDAGIMASLEAFRYLNLSNSNLRLDVFGSGTQDAEAREYVSRYGLPVKFMGWQKIDSDIFTHYQAIFVSRYLGMLEAMQSKTLVLATYNNEIKKDYLACHPCFSHFLAEDNGVSLADAFLKLDDNARSMMVEHCYDWAQMQTWKAIREVYESLWKS